MEVEYNEAKFNLHIKFSIRSSIKYLIFNDIAKLPADWFTILSYLKLIEIVYFGASYY